MSYAKGIALFCLLLFLILGLKSLNTDGFTLMENQEDTHNDDSYVQDSEDNSSNGASESTEDNLEPFYPTHEWQVVKKGQAIPAGLHVRHDLQTGLFEAKLLDDEEGETKQKKSKSLSIIADENTDEDSALKQKTPHSAMEEAMKSAQEQLNREYAENQMEDNEYTVEELKEALKKYNAKEDDVQTVQDTISKFKNYEDLKQDLHELKMDVKTDSEILESLLEEYRSDHTETERKKEILDDFEFHLHQIDNAIYFMDVGGMDILLDDLNSSSAEIRQMAAWVIGSASQSNPKVQVGLVSRGSMTSLLRLISTDPSQAVRSRCVYALSSILRQFPVAQWQFLQQGGLDVLKLLFLQPNKDKVRMKVNSLITDVILEKDYMTKNCDYNKDQDVLRMEQYNRVLMADQIREHGWCILIPSLLKSSEHEIREKTLDSMLTLLDQCRADFSRPETMEMVEHLRKEYKVLSQEEINSADSEEFYFTQLLKAVDEFLLAVRSKDEL